MKHKTYVIISLIICLVCVGDSYAAKDKGGKKDKDPKDVRIKNKTELNFGVVAKPTTGSVRVVVNRAGSIGGATTAIMLDTSNVSAGRDEIKGDNKESIQIAFSNCASNTALGLRLRRFTATYAGVNFVNSAVGLPAPGKKENLDYGATLRIAQRAGTGVHKPCYNIDVNYD